MLEHVARDTNDLDTDSNVTEYRPYAVHEDFQDTVWGLSDTTAAVIERYFYTDPYGASETKNGAGTNIGAFATNVFHLKRLHGGFVEAVSGLYDFRNRWANSLSSSWASRDAIHQDQGNQFELLRCKPLALVDPSGLSAICPQGNDCYDPTSEECPAKKCWQNIVNTWTPNIAVNPVLWTFRKSLERMQMDCICTSCLDGQGNYRAGRNPPGRNNINKIRIWYSMNLEAEWDQVKDRAGDLGYPTPPNYPNTPAEKCCPCADVANVLLHEAAHSWCRMSGGTDCQDPPGGTYDPIGDLLAECLESGSSTSDACKQATQALVDKYR